MPDERIRVPSDSRTSLVHAARFGRDRPWPRTPKAHAVAVSKIVIAEDAELREYFADELDAYAAYWWGAGR